MPLVDFRRYLWSLGAKVLRGGIFHLLAHMIRETPVIVGKLQHCEASDLKVLCSLSRCGFSIVEAFAWATRLVVSEGGLFGNFL